MEKIYTTEEIAKILKINIRTVLNLIKNKRLTAFKTGNQWRYLQSDLDKFISDNLVKSKNYRKIGN